MTQMSKKDLAVDKRELEYILKDNVRVLGSHWNRTSIKNAEVKWNSNLGKWEAEITRHLGYFDSAADAGNHLTNHLDGVQEWFLERLENGEGSHLVLGQKIVETSDRPKHPPHRRNVDEDLDV
ncbi:MAG: hypothetical protein ACJ8BW_23855 [Ktedonobacteraceae bacterium]